MIIRFSIIGAPTQRISTRNSTSNARWGVGPQHREFQKEILQAMQVGGPQHREFRKEILQAMQVGVQR
ncbi:hypothetical protein G5580_09280 [Staphylococcus aureus]|nr:hypothetical protein [Staphylococcus aureus]